MAPGILADSSLRIEARGRDAAADVQWRSISSNGAPGWRLTVSRTLLPSSRARAQWRDAFSAGHYTDEQARRFVTRLKQKAAEGMALQ